MSTPTLANYDDAGITVDPLVLGQAVTTIAGSDPNAGGGLIGEVIDALQDIMDTIDNLALSWLGSSSSEAHEFSDRWNASMTQLFGSKSDPMSGVFPRLVSGIAGARTNYDAAEDYVVKTFAAFQSSSSGSGSSTQSIVNSGGTVITAIEEQF